MQIKILNIKDQGCGRDGSEKTEDRALETFVAEGKAHKTIRR
jgi:hypothetical protein